MRWLLQFSAKLSYLDVSMVGGKSWNVWYRLICQGVNSERNLAAPWEWHCFAERCRNHRINKRSIQLSAFIGKSLLVAYIVITVWCVSLCHVPQFVSCPSVCVTSLSLCHVFQFVSRPSVCVMSLSLCHAPQFVCSWKRWKIIQNFSFLRRRHFCGLRMVVTDRLLRFKHFSRVATGIIV
jgi:hypothetical protein